VNKKLGDGLSLTIDGAIIGPFDVCPGAKIFWEGVAESRVLVRHCGDCGRFSHPRQDACENCFSANLSWQDVSGKGSIYSFSTIHRAPIARPTPYTVGIIRLDEGVHLFAGIEPPEIAAIGLRVKPVFAPGPKGVLLNFTVSDGEG
jgi:uncharacterized OB-fold protein